MTTKQIIVYAASLGGVLVGWFMGASFGGPMQVLLAVGIGAVFGVAALKAADEMVG